MFEPKTSKPGSTSQIKQAPVTPAVGGWNGKGFKKNDMATQKPGFEK